MNPDIVKLKACRGLKAEIAQLNEQILRDRQRLYGTAVQYSDLPKAQGCPSGREAQFARLCDREDVRNESLRKYQALLKEAEAILGKVADSLHRQVYRLSYMEGLPAWKVGKQCYISESTVKRIRRNAEKEEELR